jgi:hypothetical protein
MLDPNAMTDATLADQSDPQDGGGQLASAGRRSLHLDVLEKVVAKIRNEPFLFVLALVLLLSGVIFGVMRVAPRQVHFVVLVIAALAALVILGYYVLAGLQLALVQRREVPHHRAAAHPHAARSATHASAKAVAAGGEVSAVERPPEPPTQPH